MKVIVTGSSGYIGGQIALQLRDAGHQVLGIDSQEPPKQLRGVCSEFLYQDFASDVALSWTVAAQPVAVIHCAGASLVGPSMKDPAHYFNNNVAKSLRLIDTVREKLPQAKFVFSSSAATYGVPYMNPAHEVDLCEPISPYGESKLMVEQILHWYNQAYGMNYVAFRYFNACGADAQARHGQAPGATHIIARVLESLRDNQTFTLNGTDYPTDDGTCVRDYVHVADIAQAHISVISQSTESGVYNLCSNRGISNRQIIEAAEKITGRKLSVAHGTQRPGDPPILTANSRKFDMTVSGWRKYTLDDMIQHAWNWYVREDKKV